MSSNHDNEIQENIDRALRAIERANALIEQADRVGNLEARKMAEGAKGNAIKAWLCFEKAQSL